MFKISKAQILHVLGGLVFVPVATVISGWLTKHFPGLPHFTPQQIANEEYLGTASALGIALHYLHGWQLWERKIAPIVDVTDSPAKTS